MMSMSAGVMDGSRPSSALGPRGRSSNTSATGSVPGTDDAEHMLSALRQPLFIQTPLQAMLESMVEKLQTQAGLISSLQEKVTTLERQQIDSKELLERVRLMEGRINTVTGSNLSPFNQAELLLRVERLESRAAKAENEAQQLKFTAEEALEPRLKLCEQRLAGTHNLAGRLLAMDAVAAELGINIPEPQLSSITQLTSSKQLTSSAAPGGATAVQTAVSEGVMGNSRSSSGSGATASAVGVQHAVTVATLGGQVCIGPGVMTRSKQQELQQQIDAGKEAAASMQQQIEGTQQQVDELRSRAASSQDQSLTMLAGLADQVQDLTVRLDSALGQIRKDIRPAVQQAAQPSLSEFTALQSKVEAAAAATASTNKELHHIKAKEIPELRSALSDLSKKLGRGPSASVSDADKMLAGQMGVLQQQLSGLTARLEARETAEIEGRGFATKDQLQELSALMTSRASHADMQSVVGRAVDLALEAYRSCAADRATSAASTTRCLVCERTLQDRPLSPPQSAPAGASCGSSSTVPMFSSFRPSTVNCCSSTCTSTACRTHGRTTAAAAGVQSASQLNSSCLPNTSCPAVTENLTCVTDNATNYVGPGAVGEALGVGPLGPGLNAAQLRKMAEDRMHGGSTSASSTAAAANSAADQLGIDQQFVGLFARGSSPGPSCSVRYSSPAPINPIKQQHHQQQQGREGIRPAAVQQRPHTSGCVTAAERSQKQVPAVGSATADGACAANRVSSAVDAKQQQQQQQQRPGMKGHKPLGRRTPVFI